MNSATGSSYVDAGGRFVDTADSYGRQSFVGASETIIGEWFAARGRRDEQRVAYGDALDFWRVTGLTPDRRLELRAEMKLPGEAMLTFDLEPAPDGSARCRLVQTARFKPKGLLGLAYWYLVLPLHGTVFRGMLRGIQRTAVELEASASKPEGRHPHDSPGLVPGRPAGR